MRTYDGKYLSRNVDVFLHIGFYIIILIFINFNKFIARVSDASDQFLNRYVHNTKRPIKKIKRCEHLFLRNDYNEITSRIGFGHEGSEYVKYCLNKVYNV